jgi:hypothetical protein
VTRRATDQIHKFLPQSDNQPPTRLVRETPLYERDTTIERLESDHWLAGRERDEREEKESLSRDCEEEKK